MPETNFSIPGLMELQSPASDSLEKYVFLEPHDSNNTNWIGIASIGPIQFNGEPPTYQAVTVVMHFTNRFSDETLTLSSADAKITIESAVTWEFVVPEQPLPLAPGMWDWTIKVTDTRGVDLKLYAGQLIVKP